MKVNLLHTQEKLIICQIGHHSKLLISHESEPLRLFHHLSFQIEFLSERV